MTEPSGLYPVRRAAGVIQRRRAGAYTPAFRVAANSLVSASAFMVLAPLFFLWWVGIFNPLICGATSMIVGCLWALSVAKHTSLWRNQSLREASASRLNAHNPELGRSVLAFVGVSTPRYLPRAILHSDMAQEDVGMFCATRSSLIYVGDAVEIRLRRASISAIELRPYLSYILAGIHWIRITYEVDGASRYLYVQSREKERLSQLAVCNERLYRRLAEWMDAAPSLPSGGRVDSSVY